MPSKRWEQLEEIFQRAIDLAPERRAPYIAVACAGDEELRHQVEALLSQYDEAGNFLDEPVYARSGVHALAALIDDDPVIGQRIGAYQVVSQIGRGGMGAVYLAERADNAFQKSVAIKLIRRGMDTDFILRRFRHERQILAALDHPFIARLLDGGATSTGQPYFVMEYIEGQPLYLHCDSRCLPVRERLRLFCQICEAVEYAHQKQVIHRDIKPSNILVSATGVPKLFDFGIAKLLNPELTSDTNPQTATAMRMMTVEYSSPEQVQGLPVTFLSDVYSLGVLLYELLTGHRPYHFRSRQPYEMARVITEEEPEPPSVAVAWADNLLPEAGAKLETITVGRACELRGETPGGLSRELKGNLDRITMKALCKETAGRYQSAAALSEDITRHLQGSTVPAPIYTPVAATGHTGSASVQSTEAKSIAVLPLKILNLSPNTDTGDKFMSVGLADALITKLSGVRSLAVRPTSAVLRYGDEGSDPLQAGRELGVDFVLDGRIKILGERIRVSLQLLAIESGTSIWANQFDERYTDALELEDSISAKVADALLPELTEGERGQLKKRGTDNPKAFEAYMRGRYFWNQFTPESLVKVIESFQAAISLDPHYALPYVGMADFYNWASIYGMMPSGGSYPKARALALRALDIDADLGEAYAALGLVASSQWDWAESERLYRKALELSPNYSLAHEWYGSMLVGTGRFDEGLKEARRAEELDPLSPRAMTLTAWSIYQAHHFKEALAKAQQIIDLDKNFPQGYFQLGNCLEQMGRGGEAVRALEKSIRLMPDSTLPQYALCFALVAAGRKGEAREVLNEMKIRAEKGYVKPYFMAMAHAALGERDDAFELFERAFAERDHWLLLFCTEPKLNTLRSDPRFVKLLRQINNPMALRQTAVTQQVRTDSESTIAVLPLKVLGASVREDSGEEYLGLGLADALITRLSKLSRFVVRPTSSVLRYSNHSDALAAGRELGVEFVVDGAIRNINGRIRVTAQLLSVREGTARWADQFDEKQADVLELEDSISEKIVESLIPQLTNDTRRRLETRATDNAEAYEAYLRGRFHWNTLTPEGFSKAIAYSERAIALDPLYATAYASLAEYYCWLAIFGVMSPGEALSKARRAAARSVELDDRLAEGHTALGFALLVYEAKWEEAERQHRRALELNPNYPLTRVWYADQLTAEGRFREADEESARSCELDPLNPFNAYNRAWCLYQARRFEESSQTNRELARTDPHYSPAYFGLSWALRRTGAHEEAIRMARRAIETGGDTPLLLATLGCAYAEAGLEEEARSVLDGLNAHAAERFVTPYHRALVHLHLGERQEALRLLEESVTVGEPWAIWLGTEPQLDALRSEERFNELLKRINHPSARADAG
ncbi:MAG TPA: protein kinase [Pyrinomonadaceae bacterium]|nr:protein kinase [Pyrinomonadaceae bacterium]